MSLFGAMQSGVSGLFAQGQAMTVVSDNLANVNTVGYKAGRALFSQFVTGSSLSGRGANPGGALANIQRLNTNQGALQTSSVNTDMAISGNGFFKVVGSPVIQGDTDTFYTRAGVFRESKEGLLQHLSGNYLVGWQTDAFGNILNTQDPQAIDVRNVASSARPTSSTSVALNLQSNQSPFNYDVTLGTTDSESLLANLDAVVAEPSRAHFSASSIMYDSQGNRHSVQFGFMKRAENFWDYVAYADGGEIINGTPGENLRLGSGTLRFDTSGRLKEQTLFQQDGTPATNQTIDVNWSGGVDPAAIEINFGDFTGGVVFNQTDLEAANLSFKSGILDVSFREASAALSGIDLLLSNTFQVRVDASGRLFTRWDPTNTSGIGPIDSSPVSLPFVITTPLTVEFDNGVSVTLDDSFVLPTGPTQIGTNINSTVVPPKGFGSGTNGAVQFAAAYNILSIEQDGFAAGTLSSINITDEGYVVGTFTNGEAKRLYQLVIAIFPDPGKLEGISDSLFRQTDASGNPLYKTALQGNTGKIIANALEQSTVDIANEFSYMIVSQRAYQASSKIISTVDQMLNELLNLR